jgi:hypothetical protein
MEKELRVLCMTNRFLDGQKKKIASSMTGLLFWWYFGPLSNFIIC